MRLLFVVQRYGAGIAGGAEHLVRQYSERLVRRGHHVEVLTSCATSYADWADHYPPGTTTIEGVTVHRLRVARRRDNDLFAPLHKRIAREGDGHARWSPTVASLWSRRIGPELAGLESWLLSHAARFDVVVFSGYLYTPSTQGLPITAPLAPTVLQPVAHDEPMLRLPVTRRLFDHATGINFLTDEEAQLVTQRFRPPGVKRVFGAGVEPIPQNLPTDVRQRYGIGSSPYIVCVGRIDPAKGMHELAANVREYRARRRTDIKLVLVGSEVHPIGADEHVIVTGFVDEPTKWALLDDSMVLAQPSYYESFSLSLAEGWRCAKPAIVQGRNDVLAGQVARSGGGLAFRSFAEFDAGLGLLESSPTLRDRMGRSGQDYVEQYNWDAVLDSFEGLLSDTRQAWTGRSGATLDRNGRSGVQAC